MVLPANAFGLESPRLVGSAAANASAAVGRTANLRCTVKDLGQKSVRK